MAERAECGTRGAAAGPKRRRTEKASTSGTERGHVQARILFTSTALRYILGGATEARKSKGASGGVQRVGPLWLTAVLTSATLPPLRACRIMHGRKRETPEQTAERKAAAAPKVRKRRPPFLSASLFCFFSQPLTVYTHRPRCTRNCRPASSLAGQLRSMTRSRWTCVPGCWSSTRRCSPPGTSGVTHWRR